MNRNGAHLSYCLNIHPSESWQDTFTAIDTYARAVKNCVCPNDFFSLGLRLSNLASIELEPQIDQFREYLSEAGMYVVSINGFPYGRFHGQPVKKSVYTPDWSQRERVIYTKRLAGILSALLPEGEQGTISTVPVGYGKRLQESAVENLFEMAEELAEIENRSGKTIILSLEPEPDCYLDSTQGVLDLWKRLFSGKQAHLQKYIGICLDTCHISTVFENPLESLLKLKDAGILVPKVQLSNSLRLPKGEDPVTLLTPFLDRVYLHQTRVLSEDKIVCFSDLDEALLKKPAGEWRVHFHVPLHFKGADGLETISSDLDYFFLKEILQPGNHVEIETYSFDVMPGSGKDTVESVVSEYQWLLNSMGG